MSDSSEIKMEPDEALLLDEIVSRYGSADSSFKTFGKYCMDAIKKSRNVKVAELSLQEEERIARQKFGETIDLIQEKRTKNQDYCPHFVVVNVGLPSVGRIPSLVGSPWLRP